MRALRVRVGGGIRSRCRGRIEGCRPPVAPGNLAHPRGVGRRIRVGAVSRGPGFWQRAILAAFDQAESFYLVDVLPDSYTRAQYNAAHRAAQKLDDQRRISMRHFTFGTPHVVIGRPGGKPERPDNGGLGGPRHQQLIVGVGGNFPHSNTYVSDGASADLPAVQHLPVSGGAHPDLEAGQHLTAVEGMAG